MWVSLDHAEITIDSLEPVLHLPSLYFCLLWWALYVVLQNIPMPPGFSMCLVPKGNMKKCEVQRRFLCCFFSLCFALFPLSSSFACPPELISHEMLLVGRSWVLCCSTRERGTKLCSLQSYMQCLNYKGEKAPQFRNSRNREAWD